MSKNFFIEKSVPARPPPPKFSTQSHSNPNLFSSSINDLDDILKPITYTQLNNSIKNAYIKNNSTTNQPHAIVKYPYKAANADELTCTANDTVLLKREVDEEWIFATNTRSGESGIVPLLFLNIQVPLVPSNRNNTSKMKNSTKDICCWVRAIYDYETGVDGDLQVIYKGFLPYFI